MKESLKMTHQYILPYIEVPFCERLDPAQRSSWTLARTVDRVSPDKESEIDQAHFPISDAIKDVAAS